jgi:hypothetical protein
MDETQRLRAKAEWSGDPIQVFDQSRSLQKMGEPRLACLQLAALQLDSDKRSLSVSSLAGKKK